MEQPKEYYAFISYKREDEKWAKWLQDKLEHYRFPTNLNGRTDLPKHIRPTFRDVTDLKPGLLAEEINNALRNSEWLIVICSPRSAKSPWVCKEAQTFIDLGRSDHIIPFVIEGNPFSDNTNTECYPEALLNLTGSKELLAANINELGRDAAAIKVVARMFNIRFDTLWQRYEREKKRHRNIIFLSVAAFVLAVLGVALWMYIQRQETLRANWAMMENQARMVAEKSKEEVKKGNTYDAILALLELLPQDGSRPFVPELEEALRMAYNSLRSNRWNYRALDENYESAELTHDSQYIVCRADTIINILEIRSLNKYAEFKVPEEMQGLPFFFSQNTDTIFFMDTHQLVCYHLPDGQFIEDKHYSKDVQDQCMSALHNDIFYQEWPWIEEWKQNLGLPDNAVVIAYNPQRHMVFYHLTSKGEERKRKPPYYALYDCKTRQDVWKIDKDDKYYSWWNTGFLSVSFSPDGNGLAFSFFNGRGVVYDLNDFSVRPFDCGQSNECANYLNQLYYGNNGQLIHTSKYDNFKFFDEHTLELVDSIVPCFFSDVKSAQLNASGDVCLAYDMEDSFVYYLFKNDEQPSSEHNFQELSRNSLIYEDTILNQRYHIFYHEDGSISCEDLKGEHQTWRRAEKSEGLEIKGYIQDCKYMIVVRTGLRDMQLGTDIIDVTTGITVYHIPPDYYVQNVYYNKESEMLAFWKEPSLDEMVFFPSFDRLLSLCKTATQGMQLSKSARRKYYLNPE